MFGNGLLVLYRSLARHPLYAALNLLGLAAGIAVFLVLSLVVNYERSYNRWLPHADQIYRIDTTFSNSGQAPVEYAASTFVALAPLRQDFPQIRDAARVMDRSDAIAVGDRIGNEDVSYADPTLLQVLELPLLAGDRDNALSQPTDVVLSESIARQYFGVTTSEVANVVGRTIDISHDGTKRAYTVSAVINDLPPNSTFTFKLIAPFTPWVESNVQAFRNWSASSGNTYLRLTSPADAAAVNAGLRDFIRHWATGSDDNHLGADPGSIMQMSLVRLSDVHFHDVDVSSADVPGVDAKVVASMGAVGLMALLIAAVNYINLATARAGLRAREVAVRKVMGATRRMLMAQFLTEAVAVVAVAALIGLAATELALPEVNALSGWAIRIDYARVVPLLVLLVMVVGIGAGLYPAVLLAGYQPAAVLASARTPAGGRMGTRLRNLLVLAQFASAIGFAICTLVIDAQAEMLRTADRGFNRNELIIVRSLSQIALWPRQQEILARLAAVPGVTGVTVSDREPATDDNDNSTVHPEGWQGTDPTLEMENVGTNYFNTYGLRLLAGRWFDASHGQDDMKGSNGKGHTFSTVINRSAVRELGYASPQAALGQRFTMDDGDKAHFVIIGVVDNVRFTTPRDPVAPQEYSYDSTVIDYGEGAIRFSGVAAPDMMLRLEATWRQAVPDVPFEAKTADDRLADYYRPDAQRAQLFSAGAIMAVLIACVGLYGLASFSTARRIKEIGIRKVLGARAGDVLLLLIRQFVRPVVLANLIAWPVAWIAMRAWLAGFDLRVNLSPAYFLLAGGSALLIAVATVAGQALRVAYAEPAKALRYE